LSRLPTIAFRSVDDLIEEERATYFKPPYVGPSGWVGIELARVGDDALEGHLREAWQLISRKVKQSRTAGSAHRWRSRSGAS
jgi:hypothetical protein